jgi:hypothetical protein
MKPSLLALLLVLVNGPALRADEAEDKAVTAIEKVGGCLVVTANSPANPWWACPWLETKA